MEGTEILEMDDILGYLVEKVGNQVVDAAHYMDRPPFKQFAEVTFSQIKDTRFKLSKDSSTSTCGNSEREEI
jgi:hypothetical protein